MHKSRREIETEGGRERERGRREKWVLLYGERGERIWGHGRFLKRFAIVGFFTVGALVATEKSADSPAEILGALTYPFCPQG